MAEFSLKELSSALPAIVGDKDGSIRYDIHKIKEAIVGGDIAKILTSIDGKMTLISDDKNKGIGGFGGVKTSEKSQKDILKNSNTMTKILGQILKKIDKKSSGRLSGGGGGEEKSKKDGRIGRALDTIKKLGEIKLKDFILARKKLKIVDKISEKSLNIFKKFKDNKEIEETFGFVEKSVDMVQSLEKIQKSSKKAEKGVNSLETLFFGRGKKKKGGLLAIFKELYENKEAIEHGKKAIASLSITAGSMLIMTLCLAGITISAIPAMIGTLAFVAITWILSKTFKWLGKATPAVVKGALAVSILCAGIVLFAVGIGKLAKATKGLTLKDIGIMAASIAGIGLAVAGVGLLAIPIIAGGASLVIIGAALGIFALSLLVWRKFDSESAIGNIKTAVTGLKDALGIGKRADDNKKGRWDAIKGGLADMAIGFFEMGKTFATMSTILFASLVLGVVRLTLLIWENYDPSKAIGNMGKALAGMKDLLGIKDNNEEVKNWDDIGNKGLTTLGDIIDFVGSIFKMGKAFLQIGTILFASITMAIVRLTLLPWENYTGEKAIGNMKQAVIGLKDAVGLKDRDNEDLSKESFKNQALGVGSDAIALASSILQFGKTFFQLGAILLATGMMAAIRLALMPWEKYSGEKAIGNMKQAVIGLKDAVGLKDRDNEELNGDAFAKQALGAGADIITLASSILQFGKTFFQIGSILLGTAMMDIVREKLVPWDNYSSENAVKNIKQTIEGLRSAMGFLSNNQEEEKTTDAVEQKGKWYERFWNGVKKVGKKVVDGISSAAKGIKAVATLTEMVAFTAAMHSIQENLIPYDNYNPENSTGNISKAITGLLFAVKSADGGLAKSEAFRKTSSNIKDGLNFLKKGFSGTDDIKNSHESIDASVKSINSLDLDKATVMVELFKSFANIGNKPFNKFADAVDKFVNSAVDLITSMDNLRKSNENLEAGAEGGETSDHAGSFTIENTKDLAQAIANAIKSIPVNVNTDISDVRLVVNGESGRQVTISLDN